jgi:hypothetical protein
VESEFFRKLLKGCQYVPRVIITDKLKSYSAAKREILPGVEHRQSRYLNNRCENSHRPTRQRERRMQGFKSAGHAQRFLSAYGPIAQHFRPRRHLLSAAEYRQEMKNRSSYARFHLNNLTMPTRKGIVCETPRFLTLFPLQGNLAASSEESPD